MPVLLELPVPVVEGADLPGLQPAGDAVEVEGVVTHPPGHRALLAGGTRLEARKIVTVLRIQDINAVVLPSLGSVLTWLAWHSMQRSMMWLRQMAQVSTWMSQDHSALACHRFTSNLA